MLYFVLGFLTMSLFALLALIAFDDGKETLGVILSGPVFWVWLGFLTLDRYITKRLKHYNYKSALLDPSGMPCFCDSKYANYLIDVEIGYHFNDSLRDKYKIEDGWNKRDCVMNCVNVRYTPRKVVKAEGMYKVPKKVIKEVAQKCTEFDF